MLETNGGGRTVETDRLEVFAAGKNHWLQRDGVWRRRLQGPDGLGVTGERQ